MEHVLMSIPLLIIAMQMVALRITPVRLYRFVKEF
jgi:hypothetical protein